MKTPFWAFRFATKRKMFEIVRVVKYSSKGVKTDLRVGSLFYGLSALQRKEQDFSYSAFKKNYIDIKKLRDPYKHNLIESIFSKGIK